MTVVDRVHTAADLTGELAAYARDTITLGWEDRRRSHGRRVSDGGVEFAISLPSGTVLRQDDCLVLDAARRVVCVREAAEEVFVITPARSQEWAHSAYHIGNRHQPLMIGETELICLRDPAVESLLRQLGVSYSAARRAFTPAVVQHGHG